MGPETPLSNPSQAVQAPGEQAKPLSAARAPNSAKALEQATAQDGFDVGQEPHTAGNGQPTDERRAQQRLPQSPDPQWRLLAKTTITEDVKRGLFSAQHPAEVRAVAGRDVTISGYVMALDQTPTFQRFLLTRYTPVCNFCPPGAPNEVIEVQANTPIAATKGMVRVRGTFSLINDPEKGLFFKLNNASVFPAS